MNKHYRRLIDLPDIEVPRPTRETVVGFLVVLAVAMGMIACLFLLVYWIRG
jgi:hypothetical protein